MQHLRCREEAVAIGQLAVPTAGHLLGDVAELEVRLGEACHIVREIFRHAVKPEIVPGFEEPVGFGSVGRKHHAPVKDFVIQNRREAHHLGVVQNLLAVDGFREVGVEIQHRINSSSPFFGNGKVAYNRDVGIHVQKIAVNDVTHHRLEVAGAQHGGKLFIEG